jgi:hypothetical protein
MEILNLNPNTPCEAAAFYAAPGKNSDASPDPALNPNVYHINF